MNRLNLVVAQACHEPEAIVQHLYKAKENIHC